MGMKRLSLIGLGIVNERSVPIRGIDLMKEADLVFCEFFTSILEEGSLDRLEAMIGKKIEVLDRESIEEGEVVLNSLRDVDHVCLLTAGDPLTATTHQEMRMDALKNGYEVEVVHSGSIFTAAAGASGLQHYKFGRTTTIAYPEGNYFPTSPFEMILDNFERGLHTLVLLDIQAHDQRYMTAPEGADLILKMADMTGASGMDENTIAVAIARAGREDQKVLYATLKEIRDSDLGGPPHCLIIPGKLHFMEEEVLERFRN
jgi:diphthine synthase